MMATVEITNPLVCDAGKKVDKRGRVYVGKELAGMKVRVVIEEDTNE